MTRTTRRPVFAFAWTVAAALAFAVPVAAQARAPIAPDLFPNSQLYTDKEEMEALQIGSAQMLATSLAEFGPPGHTTPVHKEMQARLARPTIDAVYKASGFVAPK